MAFAGLSAVIRVGLVLGLLNVFELCFSASFYGSSYIKFPMKDSSSETEVHLRFRTSRSRGLLFLAAGDEEYCIIELRGGNILVWMDLGAGIVELQSTGIKLNDLLWHNLELARVQEKANLTIDGTLIATADSPGKSFELTVEEGIFLGGVGHLDKDYIGESEKNFRGCLSDVMFNGVDVFNTVREFLEKDNLKQYVIVQDITWDCSAEFSAAPNDPISFTDTSSYVTFSRWDVEESGSFSCWLKTHGDKGLLLYNTGEDEDFIAVELVEGRIRMLLNKGMGTVNFHSTIQINDRKWHEILLRIDESFLEISIDQKPEIMTLTDEEGELLELSGPLFVGGVVERARSVASRQDLASVTGEDDGGSFQGCIQEIEINYVAHSLEDSRVTHHITAGCVWEYPCTSKQPCIPEAECTESGFAEFECQCNLEVCYKPTEDPTAIIEDLEINVSETDTKKKNKKEKKKEKTRDREKSKKFLLVEPLEVMEGGEAVITSDQIKVNGDLSDLGLRESQVMFRVTRDAKFGEIIHDVLRREDNSDVFTLLDVIGGRIIYSHGGSENFQDRLTFEVNVLGNDGELPESLQKDNNFVLRIEITPVNDPPQLILPDDSLVQLIENTKRMMSSDILNAVDPDTDATEVTYSLLNEISSMGYLENTDNPDHSISSFTQEDVNLGKIFFVHDGAETKSRIGLRVSDPIDRSDPVSLRVEAIPLQLTVAQNSGIKVNLESSVIIKSDELQVVTNAPGQDLSIRFDVILPPEFGELQHMDEPDWTPVRDDFTQRQINKDKIRYVHSVTGTDEMEDSFQLQATCMEVSTDIFSVHVQVMALAVRVVNNTNLIMDVIKEKTIIPEHLGAVLVNNIQNNYTIRYTVTREPDHGHVVRHGVGHLMVGDHFTQDDINAGNIGFRIKHHIQTAVNDTFQFYVSTLGYQSSAFTFAVSYIPDKLSTSVFNAGITIGEGMSRILTPGNLNVENPLADYFQYTVTVAPENGSLQFLDQDTMEVIQWSVTSFTSEDLREGLIQYQHDDSETMQDSFKFMAAAITNEPELKTSSDAIVNGMFNITIEMKNDNKPQRVVDKVFKVVENGERLLTDADLKYTDADIDFDDDNLEYSRQRIANGELVNINNVSVPVYQFTQKDLKAGNILFKHKGSSFGRMVFFVYDDNRSKFTSGLLEIEAAEPYIEIIENTGLVVQKGKAVMVSAANLSIDTNLNAKDKNIEFFITALPEHGKLFKKGEGGDLESFNLEVLKNDRIRYQHDESESMMDSFNFSVRIKDFEVQGHVPIKIFLKSHQNPPEIGQNKILVVTEMGAGTIKKSHLKATHRDSSPTDIVFHVTTQALNGYLRLLTKESAERLGGGEEDPTSDAVQTTSEYEGSEKDFKVEVETEFIVSFTQMQINQGRVQYVEMAPGEVSDQFIFEVTNGMTTLRDQVFEIDIIPDIIPLRVKNIEVREGGSKALTEKYIKVNNKHIKNTLIHYTIVTQPTKGQIEHTRTPGEALTSFTTEDVANEFIYYVHDDSDSLHDQFTILANASSQKFSDRHVINVTITPINDEPPEIVSNRGMEVFTDSVTPVSSYDLSAADPDTKDDELYFILTDPTNGYMALIYDIKTPILNFTQADIVNERVVFVHSGARTGGFRFQVNDGENSANRQIFSITAKPLVVSVITNTGIDVYPDSLQPITGDHLKAVTNEKPAKMSNGSIIFVIANKPALGKVVKTMNQGNTAETDQFEEVTTFSQEEINKGTIKYKHDKELSKWSEKDGFIFSVYRSAARNVTDQQFFIRISYGNVGGSIKSPLLANTGAKVGEGDFVVITSENLDASNLYAKVEDDLDNYIIEYNITRLPAHGVLTIDGNNVTQAYVTFNQEDLARGAVKYIHDHSDSLKDSFGFDVALGNTAMSSAERAQSGDKIADDGDNNNINLHDSFNFTILPVNDQPFTLLTLAPGMELVQGINKIITRENLETQDPDTPPEEIVYEIIDGPSNGRIALTSDHSLALREFTQKHIDDKVLIFIHNGRKEPGAFYFRVSDSVHKDVYKMFNLNVIPLSLTLVNNTGIELLQGDLYAPITRTNLAARTNGHRGGIMYNITRMPSHGILLINEQPLTSFSQFDVDNELLAYLQNDKSASEDEFEFVVYNSENTIPANVFKMTVQAIVKKKHFTLRSGNSNHLTTDELDATELANRTLSNPTFEIVQFPQYCQLIDASTSQPIYHFTQRDLLNRNVLIFAQVIQMDNKTSHVQDSMVLSLRANNVQPAQVVLLIHIKPVKAKKFPVEETTEEIPNVIDDYDSYPDKVDPDDTEQDDNRVHGWYDDDSYSSYDDVQKKAVTPTTSGNNSLGGPGSSLVDPNAVSGSQLAVIIPIIVVIALATVVVIVVIWRMKRKDQKPDQVDSPYPEPDEPPLPVVQPQRPPIPGSPIGGPLPPPQQVGSPIPSPGMTERSPLAPQVTVTPLGMAPGMEDPTVAPNYQNMAAGVAGPSGQSVVSLASSGSGVMVYNMQTADPEMAEHCRTSNPTLQKNQYWV